MLKTGSQFAYEVPDGWTEFREGTRYVFQTGSPQEYQELIVQGNFITGHGAPADGQRFVDELFENGITALRRATNDEPFVFLKDLGPDAPGSGPPRWSFVAEHSRDKVLLCGAVFKGAEGVLLLTFEASSRDARDTYEAILESVRLVSAEEGKREPGEGRPTSA